MSAPSLVWLRDDLRIADNPALSTAAERGPVVVLYVLDEASPGIRPLGGASRWWLHGSLEALGGRARRTRRRPRSASRRGRGDRARGRRGDRRGGRLLEPAVRRRGARGRHRGEGRAAGARAGCRIVRGFAALRAVDGADRLRHTVLGLHAVLERVPRAARAAASAARARARGGDARRPGRRARGLGPEAGPTGLGRRPAGAVDPRRARRTRAAARPFSPTTSATTPRGATPWPTG